MKKILPFTLLFIVTGCVSGPPTLSQDQLKKLGEIEIYKEGENPSKKYEKITEISAADCTGAPAGGRVWGNAEMAIQTLKMKAASKNADAIINASCTSVPFVNNCWAAQKCDGIAIKWLQ